MINNNLLLRFQRSKNHHHFSATVMKGLQYGHKYFGIRGYISPSTLPAVKIFDDSIA
jgi:hypothetical protein